MNWKQALNWLIAVLLAVNLFLLGVLWNENRQRLYISSATAADAVTVLRRYGVELDLSAVERRRPTAAALEQKNSAQMMTALLKTLSAESYTSSYAVPGATVYNTENFRLTLSSDGRVDFGPQITQKAADPSQTAALTADAAQARRLGAQYAFLSNGRLGFRLLSVTSAGDSLTYALRQTYDGRLVYGNELELTVTEGRVSSMKGLWLFDTISENGSLQCRDAATLLLGNKLCFYGEHILSTSWGYYTAVRDGGSSAALTPCWAVETEKAVRYFDAVSGEEVYPK